MKIRRNASAPFLEYGVLEHREFQLSKLLPENTDLKKLERHKVLEQKLRTRLGFNVYSKEKHFNQIIKDFQNLPTFVDMKDQIKNSNIMNRSELKTAVNIMKIRENSKNLDTFDHKYNQIIENPDELLSNIKNTIFEKIQIGNERLISNKPDFSKAQAFNEELQQYIDYQFKDKFIEFEQKNDTNIFLNNMKKIFQEHDLQKQFQSQDNYPDLKGLKLKNKLEQEQLIQKIFESKYDIKNKEKIPLQNYYQKYVLDTNKEIFQQQKQLREKFVQESSKNTKNNSPSHKFKQSNNNVLNPQSSTFSLDIHQNVFKFSQQQNLKNQSGSQSIENQNQNHKNQFQQIHNFSNENIKLDIAQYFKTSILLNIDQDKFQQIQQQEQQQQQFQKEQELKEQQIKDQQEQVQQEQVQHDQIQQDQVQHDQLQLQLKLQQVQETDQAAFITQQNTNFHIDGEQKINKLLRVQVKDSKESYDESNKSEIFVEKNNCFQYEEGFHLNKLLDDYNKHQQDFKRKKSEISTRPSTNYQRFKSNQLNKQQNVFQDEKQIFLPNESNQEKNMIQKQNQFRISKKRSNTQYISSRQFACMINQNQVQEQKQIYNNFIQMLNKENKIQKLHYQDFTTQINHLETGIQNHHDLLQNFNKVQVPKHETMDPALSQNYMRNQLQQQRKKYINIQNRNHKIFKSVYQSNRQNE